MVAIGCVIKTPGSSKNNKTGSWRTFKPILDKEKCIDCDNCIIFCPDSSVNKQHDKLFLFIQLHLKQQFQNTLHNMLQMKKLMQNM